MNYIFSGVFFIGISTTFYGLIRMWKKRKEIDNYQEHGVLTQQEIQTRLMRVEGGWIIVMTGLIICFSTVAFYCLFKI